MVLPSRINTVLHEVEEDIADRYQAEVDRLGSALQKIAERRPPKSRHAQAFEQSRREAREALGEDSQ